MIFYLHGKGIDEQAEQSLLPSQEIHKKYESLERYTVPIHACE